MKRSRLLKILTFAALIAFPMVGQAQEIAGNLDQQSEEFGKTFIPLAAQFGFTEYVYAAKSDSGMILFEYLKPGENLESWKNMATVSLFPVAETEQEAAEALPQYAALFRSGTGRILEEEEHDTEMGKLYFTHYDISAGPIKESNLSLIWQIMPGVIGNFQVQRRPDDPSPQDVDNFKHFMTSMISESARNAKPEAAGEVSEDLEGTTAE